ncbi:MAG TPA: hypothetical protein VGF47_08915, partial [Solirubrobacteraceae bacterium]
MTGTLVAVVAVAAVVIVALLAMLGRTSRGGRRIPGAVIGEAYSLTSLDDTTGAVRSVQSAVVSLPPDALEQIWSPENLERLARTYWRFLSRVTLGLIHVAYGEQDRSIVLLTPPLKLLTFHAPEYEMSDEHGLVRWRIARGLLVSKPGHDGEGYLQIEVRRGAPAPDGQTRLHVAVEVANF